MAVVPQPTSSGLQSRRRLDEDEHIVEIRGPTAWACIAPCQRSRALHKQWAEVFVRRWSGRRGVNSRRVICPQIWRSEPNSLADVSISQGVVETNIRLRTRHPTVLYWGTTNITAGFGFLGRRHSSPAIYLFEEEGGDSITRNKRCILFMACGALVKGLSGTQSLGL